MAGSGHIPVLGEPVMRLLSPRPGDVCVDCTVGRAGHARMLAEAIAPGGHLIGLDADSENVAYAREQLADVPVKVDVFDINFSRLPAVMQDLQVEKVDVLLADLGFASNQMDDPARGFSFQHDGPLDMRLDRRGPTTAEYLVNHLPQDDLADVLYHFGDERLSRKIARKIVEAREQHPISTSKALAELVRRAYGPRGRQSRIDPATRTFMALRIAVNGELDALDSLLGYLPRVLAANGRAGIISFHSLEDRRVKQAFAALKQSGVAERLTKKPEVATDAERRDNPRSRSAKFRAIRMIAPAGGREDGIDSPAEDSAGQGHKDVT